MILIMNLLPLFCASTMLYCFISLSSGAKAAFVSYIQLVVATEQSGIASVCKPLAVQAIQGLSKDHNDSVRHHTL